MLARTNLPISTNTSVTLDPSLADDSMYGIPRLLANLSSFLPELAASDVETCLL